MVFVGLHVNINYAHCLALTRIKPGVDFTKALRFILNEFSTVICVVTSRFG